MRRKNERKALNLFANGRHGLHGSECGFGVLRVGQGFDLLKAGRRRRPTAIGFCPTSALNIVSR
jgi:hypothetical protein